MAGTCKIDNIIIGTPFVDPKSLGIMDDEATARLTFDEACNEQGNIFLPTILKQLGIFKSTNEIRQIDKQRKDKIQNDPNQGLWRNIEVPEFTEFKVGKKIFWLLVGVDDGQTSN